MPGKKESSCFKSPSSRLLQRAASRMGLRRRGNKLFLQGIHVANVLFQRYLFVLMGGGCYEELVAKAKEIAYLEPF
jgi:hypothetical protein